MWPQAIITWSRFIAGSWRDPIVARDILVGLAGALLTLCVEKSIRLTVVHFGGALSGPIPFYGDVGFVLDNLTGWRAVASTLVVALFRGATISLTLFFILFLCRVIFKRAWFAVMVFVIVAGAFAPNSYLGRGEIADGLLAIGYLILAIPVMSRLGLLATSVWVCVSTFASHSFLTTNFTAWYGASSLTTILVVSAVALWAFHVAIGGWANLGLRPSTPSLRHTVR